MAKKSCKKGYYYCNTDKKCKRIPKGYHIMPTGYLMKDSAHKEEDKEETKKKNGNGANGNGNGNGESNGGSDGGGVSEAWSAKYKKSIDCDNPKGFSQRAHCRGRKMNEAKGGDHEVAMAQSQLKKSAANIAKLRKALGKKEKDIPAWMQAKITDTAHDTDAAAGYVDKMDEEVIAEKRDGKSAKDKGYSLRDWFKGGGWVQAGGKYDGKPCARQPGQKTKPFCRDADDRANMSKKERERRAKKKRREDSNPDRRGKAKMVTASYSNWRSELEDLHEIPAVIGIPLAIGAGYGLYKAGQHLYKKGNAALDNARQNATLRGNPFGAGARQRAIEKSAGARPGTLNPNMQRLRNSYEPEGELVDEGKKDACYHKVKSRYKVWPSAYASGALVKCRKVGAKNWGNKSEGFSDWRTEMVMEGKLEDRLLKMSDDEFRQFIKGRTGPEADTFRQKRESARAAARASVRPSSGSQGSGPQMPTDFAKQGISSKPRTISVADYANRNMPNSAWQRAQQNPSAYRPGPGVKPDFSGVNPRPRPRPVTPGAGRPRTRIRGGKLGLAVTAAGLAAPIIMKGIQAIKKRMEPDIGVHKYMQKEGNNLEEMASEKKIDKKLQKPVDTKKFNPSKYVNDTKLMPGHGIEKKIQDDYQYSNWRDDFQATEYESVDIIKAEPLQPTQGIGSDMLDEKKRLMNKLDKISGQLKKASAMHAKQSQEVAKAADELEEAKKCWKGYKKVGTQKLFGKTYNRCVKAHFSDWRADMDLQEKKAKKNCGCGKDPCETYGKQEVKEDWQKSNRKDGVDGMSQKSVNAYRRENPGSKLQTAVTEKKPKGKRAKRRKSFCARSKGQKDMHNIDCSKTPEKKICKARKRWRC